MGGIFGVVCSEPIPRGVMLEGLRRLIYRGYDGAGVAIHRGNAIEIRKSPGHLLKVAQSVDFVNIDSNIAVGHVRYASRGWPVYENTHPLQDCTGRIAVVEDGIIDNYEEVKEDLERKGHAFTSRTDTEVAAHMLEEYLKTGVSVVEALIKLANKLEGVYALAILVAGDSAIYIVQHGQPLVIGLSQKCIYVASDLPSLYGFADTAYIVSDYTVGRISLDSVDLYSTISRARVELSALQAKSVKYPAEYVEKGGYPHYMIKEIYETPQALINTTHSIMEKYLRLASMIIYGARQVYAIGTGTSLHAAMTSTYYFSELAGMSITPISAAEFPYSVLESVATGTVVVAISQSGETTDVINSVKLAKQRGAVVLGITNNVGSRLALESNVYLPIGAGPEMAVPATKTFSCTLAALLMLAGYTGLFSGKVSQSEYKELVDQIRHAARILQEKIPEFEEKTRNIACEIQSATSMYLASSGITHPIAIEGALKLKEAALVHAEGMQLGELRHGPLSIANPNFPVILIEPFEEKAHPLYIKVLRELEHKNTKIISLESKLRTKYHQVEIPSTSRYTYPIMVAVVLQLLAYNLGVAKGLPVDTPPGLAKTITT